VKKLITILIALSLFLLSTNPYLLSLKEDTSINPSFQLKQQYAEFFNEGEKFRAQGEYEKSIEAFENSFDLAKRINNKINEMNSLQKLALLNWNIGQLDKSLEFYQKAGVIAEELNLKKRMEQLSNCWLIYKFYKEAKEYRNQGQNENSIKCFEKAIELARKIKSKEHEVKCLRQLSLTYYSIKDLNEFKRLNKEALEIARSLNHEKEEGRCLNHIGIYHRGLDNYSQALKNYNEALRIAKETKNIKEISVCLNNIGIVYDDMGNYEKALECLKESISIDRQRGDDSYIVIDLNNIGVTYRKKALLSNNKEDFDNALEYFNDCLALARKINDIKREIQTLNNIGTVHTDRENYPKALHYFRMALKKAEKLHDKEAIAHIRNNIGIVYYYQGDYEKSTEYYQDAIALALELEEGETILEEAYLEIANAYKKQEKYQKALENYKNSIYVIDNIRSRIKLEEFKATYLGTEKRIEPYHNLIDLLYELHQSNPENEYNFEAFEYLEKAKARAFLDRLESSEVDTSKGVNPRLLNQESEIMKDISQIYNKLLEPELNQEQVDRLNKKLTENEDKLENLKREIRISSPAYADLRYPKIISLKEAQKKLLDDKTAFFEYCLGKENSYAFVVTKEELKIFPLPPTKKIQTIVKDYLMAISDKENQDFNLGYELFSSLVFPGLDEKIERLFFVPDDILNYLPFETLICRKNEKHWLINDYRIAYVPSISSLRELMYNKKRNNRTPRKDILAFGDPCLNNHDTKDKRDDLFQDYFSLKISNLYQLQYSGLEIEGIASLFKETKRNIFKREKSTEEQLKALNLADYKILHFATHSLIDDKKPARSSIILSLNNNNFGGNKNPEDGQLQMREIFNLKLNSDLVTLSACQTGLGQFIRGEGIESLNRAFFFAGASSVIMSLWPVNDLASSQLMKRFYTHLCSSESIMDALQKTKLEMIASGTQLSHPYYWSGFIVTGKADEIIFPSPQRKLIIALLSLLVVTGGIIALIRFKEKIYLFFQ